MNSSKPAAAAAAAFGCANRGASPRARVIDMIGHAAQGLRIAPLLLLPIGLMASTQASAQQYIQPPILQVTDGNGMSLTTGKLLPTDLNISIGDQQSGLSRSGNSDLTDNYSDSVYFHTYVYAPGYYQNIGREPPEPAGYDYSGGMYMDVSYEGTIHTFLIGGGASSGGTVVAEVFIPQPWSEQAGQARLSCNGNYQTLYSVSNGRTNGWNPGGTCTMVLGDGTTVVYNMSLSYYPSAGVSGNSGYNLVQFFDFNSNQGVLQSATKPDGETITPTYNNYPLPPTAGVTWTYGINTVSSSKGWMLQYSYDSHYNITKITALNSSAIYCNPTSTACSGTSSFPTVTANYSFAGSAITETIARNGTNLMTYSSYDPSNSVVDDGGTAYFCVNGLVTNPNVSYTGGTNVILSAFMTATTPFGRMRQYTPTACLTSQNTPHYPANETSLTGTLTKGTSTWTYTTIAGSDGIRHGSNTTITEPNGGTKVVGADGAHVLSVTDELGRVTTYTYNPDYKNVSMTLASLTTSDGIVTAYSYDTHGNVIKKVVTSKGGASTQTTSATYPVSTSNTALADPNCTHATTCNKPITYTDENGNTTQYTYDPTTGFLLTETGPVDATGVQPQTRYRYAQFTPQIMNASSQLVASAPVWKLAATSTCKTATTSNPASCVGTANETVTTYSYSNNNLLLTSVTVAGGDGSNPSLMTYAYDTVGNKISVKGPRTDVDDTRYTTYDLLRRPIFEIGADPDGTGPLPRVAVHHLYDVDGNEYQTERGTCNTTTCTDFQRTSYSERFYDPTIGNLVKTTEVSVP